MNCIKTYKIHDNEAIINLTYAGVDVTCHFKDGNIRMGKWATLHTSNEIVQRAIETSEMYGRFILPEGEPIKMPIKMMDSEKPVNPSDITNIQQLRDYLVNEYKCDKTKIASPNALKAKVKEFGLELPNMQW